MREVAAPGTGEVREIKVHDGESVRNNQELFVIEAPGLSTLILAPETGVVAKVVVKTGEPVKTGQLLAWIEPKA